MTDCSKLTGTEEHTAEVVSVADSPTLAESVELAVSGYINAMDGQKVRDLYELVLSEVEAPLLNCVLKSTSNNQSQTALILGLNRGTLRKKLKKYGLL
jgi:Fis family transcriptional regulator